MEEKKEKMKIGIGAWIALIFFIVILSGVFRTSDTPLQILDLTNLTGNFGLIGETESNFIGSGGSGAKDGFMAGLNLLPGIMLFCGLLGVFEQMKAFDASEIVFRTILKPLLGIPGRCGVAFVSSFNGSDVAAIMTRDLYEAGDITDDQRTIFVSYQYAASACITNTINCGAPILAFCPIALGVIIVIEFVCKLIGANLVRLIIRLSNKKKGA